MLFLQPHKGHKPEMVRDLVCPAPPPKRPTCPSPLPWNGRKGRLGRPHAAGPFLGGPTGGLRRTPRVGPGGGHPGADCHHPHLAPGIVAATSPPFGLCFRGADHPLSLVITGTVPAAQISSSEGQFSEKVYNWGQMRLSPSFRDLGGQDSRERGIFGFHGHPMSAVQLTYSSNE